MNKLKKLLALLLCAAMTLAVVPSFAVEAKEPEPIQKAAKLNAAAAHETNQDEENSKGTEGATANVTDAERDSSNEVALMASGTYYPDLQIWFDAGSGTITDADESISGYFDIPEMIDSKKVLIIGNSAFENCASLTGVNIPKTVTKIGDIAFKGCTNLSQVTLNYNSEREFKLEINKEAFLNCINLTELTLPETVTYLGDHFIKGTSISSLTIPKSVTKAGENYGGPLAGCETLTNVTLEDGIVSIPDSLFNFVSSTSYIENIVIPESVVTIGKYAFRDCTSITEINIPKAVTNINGCAFQGCTELSKVTLNNNSAREFKLEISYEVFKDCEKLSELILPGTVTYLGDHFIAGTSIPSLVIPKSVTKVGENYGGPLAGCTALTNVTLEDGIVSVPDNLFNSVKSTSYIENIVIPESVVTIGRYAFRDCTSITEVNIPKAVTDIGDHAFLNCINLTELTLPETVTYLGDHFIEGTSISSLTIPKSLTKVGENYGGPLAGCTALTYVTLEDGIVSIPDNLFNFVSSTSYIENIVIPESVVTIGKYAFRDCTSITEMNIPKAVTNINGGAFQGCTKLLKVTLNNNSAREFKLEISYEVFKDCEKLSELILPGTVTYLGDHFIEGTSISSLTIPKSVTKVGEDNGGPLANCTALTNVTLEDGTVSIPDSLFNFYSSTSYIENIVIPESVVTIGKYAFRNCASITEINIPKAVTDIGEHAFLDCINLTELTLPETVTYIGDHFIEGTSISSLTIPKSVTKVGEDNGGPLANCTALTNVTLEDGIVNIPDSLFNFYRSTSYIENIVIPESVVTIGKYAFRNCASITEINIPKAVEKIGDNAFLDCINLRRIKFNDNNPLSIGNKAFSGCSKITSLTLPEGVTYLGDHFIKDTKISSITVPKTLTSVGENNGGPFCGAIYLDNVFFENGITAIPKNMCRSVSCNSYISRVEIPDTVTSIGQQAFGNCTSLEKLFIPDSVTSVHKQAFEGAVNLTIQCSEASPAIEAIIDNDMQFQLTHEITAYDHLVYKNTDYYSDINNMTGYVPFVLKYEVKSGINLEKKQIVIRIPTGSELIESTLKENGVISTNYDYKDDKLVMPVENNSGTITFSVRPTEYNTLLTYAMMKFQEDGQSKSEVIGVLNCSIPDISINAESVVNSASVPVEGIAPPSGKVTFYVDGSYAGETEAIRSGNYKATVTLPEPENYKRYTVTASAVKNGEEVEASTIVKYQEDVPTLESLVLQYGDHDNIYRYELADDNPEPAIVFNPHLGFRFEVKVTHPEDIEKLYIVSTRNNQKKYMEAKWDEASGMFVAEGLFEGTDTRYVPGTISVEFIKKKREVPISPTLSNEEAQNIYDHLDERFKNCETEVVENSDGKFEAKLYVDESLKDVMGDEVELFVEEIEKNYADIPISDLMSEAENIYSYFIDRDGEKYVLNLDFTDPGTLTMVVHDISDSKMIEYGLEFMEFSDVTGEFKAVEIISALEGISEISGTLADMYEIYNDDKELRDKIYSSNLTPSEREEALKKADELKTDRMAFLAITSIIAAVTLTSVGAPAVVFGVFVAAIGILAEFAWEFREADILSGGKLIGLKWSIDPSGYVYEAVESNRVEGVTATAYWIAPEFIGEDGSFDESKAVVWDAAEYAQLNPLTTDMNGAYAWDVPEGLWQVKFEKDGYETLVTEWLPVPPPQTDVNVGMVSTVAPTVMAAELYANSLTLTFDKYMQPETVENITVDGVSGVTVTPVDAEAAPDGTVYARSYSIGFNESLIGGTAHTVSVADAVSYAGTEMTPYSRSLTVVKAEITDITAKPYGDVVRVSVSAENVPAGAVVYLAAYDADGSMLSLNNAKFVNGIAAADVPIEDVVRVKALLWSSISDMIPLCEAKEVEVTQ